MSLVNWMNSVATKPKSSNRNISPSAAKKELNEKFNLYERSGILEYQVIFPNFLELFFVVLMMKANKDPRFCNSLGIFNYFYEYHQDYTICFYWFHS